MITHQMLTHQMITHQMRPLLVSSETSDPPQMILVETDCILSFLSDGGKKKESHPNEIQMLSTKYHNVSRDMQKQMTKYLQKIIKERPAIICFEKQIIVDLL